MIKELTFPIEEVIQETEDTVTLRLKKTQQFDYFPGQFITIDIRQFKELENIERGKKVGPRAYSIGSSPTRDHVDITVKKEDKGRFSVWIVEEKPLKKGDFVTFKGPWGHFIYEENYGDVVLIGAGSGIVPLKTILEYIADKKLKASATLLYSNKTQKDIIYKKELDSINSSNVKIHYTLTQEQWNGRTGRINEQMIKECVGDLQNKRYYLCGPMIFAKEIKEILIKKNVKQELIKVEAWG